MVSNRSLIGLSLCASLSLPVISSASTFNDPSLSLNLDTPVAAQAEDGAGSSPKQEVDPSKPVSLDAAPAAAPEIHGFFDSPFKTAYITPRGVVVQDKGLVWQPVGGLIIPLVDLGPITHTSMDFGVWNSVTTAQNDPQVGAWNEMDVWFGVGGDITDQIHVYFDYEAWNFPNSSLNKPKTEHISQLKFSFNDSKFWGKSGFSVNPWVNFFYEWGGSSTVVNGKPGQTGYVELGIAPSYSLPKEISGASLSFPIYVQVGPKDYWGRNDSAETKPDGNIGVFSAGVKASLPLTFIPVKYGHWSAQAGVLYYYLINDALLRAGGLLSGNTDRSKFNGYVGFSVGF